MAALTLNLIIGAATGAPGAAHGQDAAPSEYQMKAAFLYNFAKYVDWPVSVLPEHAPLVFGVYGDDPFDGALQTIIHDKVISGHGMIVRHITSLRDVTNCHVLFISKSESRHLEEITTALRGRPILTVSDTEGFKRQGGMIGLIKADNNIRFEINREAAAREGLLLSSKLLRLDTTAPVLGENPVKPPGTNDPK